MVEPVQERTVRERHALDSARADAKRLVEKLRREGMANTPEEISGERREFLEMVDFDELRRIFEEMAGKSLGKSVEVNLVGPDRIVFTPSHPDDPLADYSPVDNLIRMSSRTPTVWDKDSGTYHRRGEQIEELNRWIVKENVEAGSKELHLFRTLVHEETHATGHNVCIGPANEVVIDLVRSGYSVYRPSLGPEQDEAARQAAAGDVNLERGRLFQILNEGVTEKIAVQVIEEYLRRKSWPQQEAVEAFRRSLARRYGEGHDGEESTVSVLVEMAIVDELVDLITEDVGVSSDKVWQAFVEGYFRGRPFYENEDLRSLFRQTFGEYLSERVLPRIDELSSTGRAPGPEEVLGAIREARRTKRGR